MTLVELLVVVAILGVISFALTESVILGLRTTTATQEQVAGSVDRQRLATHFVPDVQSAERVDLDPACVPGAATPVVTLSRTERDGKVKTASYLLQSTAEGSGLVRHYCEGTSLVNEKLVVENLDGVPEPNPPCGVDGTCTLTVRVTDDRGNPAPPYTVSATRRAG